MQAAVLQPRPWRGAARRIGKHSTARSAALGGGGQPAHPLPPSSRTAAFRGSLHATRAPRSAAVGQPFLVETICGPNMWPESTLVGPARARGLGRSRAFASAPDAFQERSLKGQSNKKHTRNLIWLVLRFDFTAARAPRCAVTLCCAVPSQRRSQPHTHPSVFVFVPLIITPSSHRERLPALGPASAAPRGGRGPCRAQGRGRNAAHTPTRRFSLYKPSHGYPHREPSGTRRRLAEPQSRIKKWRKPLR